jgi:two-component system, NtrC family, response regulator GlrR
MSQKNSVEKEVESAGFNLSRNHALKKIIGCSPAVLHLKKKLLHVSSCDVSVLISGESGTGKELAARAIHYLSARASKPFIPINCGAIPENLFENEMFGHCRGAFTDAVLSQKGLIEEAEGGTLFLDEIGSVSPYVQVKLLRFLQEKKYKVLGASKLQKSNVRIVAATNEDLLSLVKNKSFREDLYYRINIINISVPPLRWRRGDIPLLVDYFLHKYSIEYKRQVTVSDALKKRLAAYSWPGNVRELENRIQQIIVMSSPEIKTIVDDIEWPPAEETIPESLPQEPFNDVKARMIQRFEKDYLNKLMMMYKGDVVSAAKKMGKGRTALWNLLSKYDIRPKNFE